MLIALVTDAPRPGARVTREYTQRVVNAVAAMTGQNVITVEVPAVTEAQPGGKQPPLAKLRAAHKDLLERLTDLAPDAVVSLGGAALNALNPDKKSIVLKNEHGRMRWIDTHTDDHHGLLIPWVPTVAAFQVVKSSDLHRDFAAVIYKAVTQHAPLTETEIEVVIPTTAAEFSDALHALEAATVVGVDVETTGLSAWRDGLLAAGIGAVNEDGSYGYAVVLTQEMLSQDEVQDILWDAVWRRSRRSVGHNFKFDMQFMQPLIDWAPREALLGDTMLLGHLIDERPTRPTSRARGSGLKDHVAQRYDLQYGFSFDEQFYQLEGEERAAALQDMYVYLGKDVVYTARLWHDLVREADAESPRILEAHDRLLAKASVAIAKCELAGAPVDTAWIAATLATIEDRIARRTTALVYSISRLALTHDVTNILAPAQVADVMYDGWGMTPDIRKHGQVVNGDRSTDEDHIEAAVAKYIRSADPVMRQRARWLRSLVKLRKDTKVKTTYEKSILGRMDDDGRVRASFLLHGTSTGRLSSREPNLQNIPAVGRIGSDLKLPMRRAFRPKDGRLWVEVDYSQLELRVAAGISQDEAFTEVFRGGHDVHLEIASSIFSKEPENIAKAERFLAKSVSFGVLYGRTAKAIAGGAEMDYAVRELGMTRWTEEQAQAFIRKFLRSYPQLDAWIEQTHATAPAAGYVESPFGRRRRFPLMPQNRSELGSIQRQAVNTPIQSAASDICLSSLIVIQQRIEDEGLDAQVLFPVHDSICIEVDAGQVDRLEVLCRSVMEKPFMGVPLTVDFEFGPTWADVHDLATWEKMAAAE